MLIKITIFTMLLLFAVVGCAAPEDQWQTFKSDHGNFSVLVPEKLVESATIAETPLGFIETRTLSLHQAPLEYAITYTDYPVPGAARANPLGALEGSVSRTLDSYSATLVTKKDITLDETPGIEFRGTFSGGQASERAGIVYGRVYLFDARIYQLVVIARDAQVETASHEKFFASFQWLNPAARTNAIAK